MKRGALAAIAGLLLIGGSAVAVKMSAPAPASTELRPALARPKLALLTSLPLMFAESFSLEGGSPTLERLEQLYRVEPIAVADARSLSGKKLLLMAHPRAQPAEVLVELDAWVRAGGRLLLLADPRLDWHSDRPLGDPLRPPPDFADTGLLAHWGLTLEGPTVDGPSLRVVRGRDVLFGSPGRLISRGACRIGDGMVARCRIGRGKASIIADADFLNVAGPNGLDGPTAANLDLLIDELVRLDSR
ncbi:MAG TPA: hypothetical protein VNI79_09100 [Sphingomicrobium sp.]|nr:hypothetical protein [Sphingomicrobium sp.]